MCAVIHSGDNSVWIYYHNSIEIQIEIQILMSSFALVSCLPIYTKTDRQAGRQTDRHVSLENTKYMRLKTLLLVWRDGSGNLKLLGEKVFSRGLRVATESTF